MKEAFHLKQASCQDADDLASFVNAAYRGDSSRQGWTTEADLLGGQRINGDMLREQIATPHHVILQFYAASKRMACVALENRQDRAYLGMFTVSPHLQNNGIGKAILHVTESWIANKWNINHIEMKVITRRLELIAWYIRRGYSDTGRREPFPGHDPNYGILKVSPLEMMILEKRGLSDISFLSAASFFETLTLPASPV